jgi:acetyl-CoA C-acetyltransferase
VEAVRSPIGRRDGALSGVHPAELLAKVLRELVDRTGIDPADVGQVVGGCVGQVGEQALNVTRTAWLSAGLPLTVAATTVDAQCGSSQQATAMATALVSSGIVDVAIGCGTEAMSRVPMGSNTRNGLGNPLPESYTERYEATTQFEGAERIAERWGITRDDTDGFGLLSQQRAHAAWSQQRFDSQVVAVDAPAPDSDNGATRKVERDEGLRETSL